MTLFLLAMIAHQAARNEEDLGLLLRVVERDQIALSLLYDMYASLVYTLALRVVRRTNEAEDVLQEVFLKIWNRAGTFSKDKGSVYTWIVTIARRTAIDHLRSKETLAMAESIDDGDRFFTLPDPAYSSNPLHAAIDSEHESLMRKGLAGLSPDQRTVIEMSYYEGYTQEQISRRLSVPLGTVKTRMRQGLIKLRDNLQGRIGE